MLKEAEPLMRQAMQQNPSSVWWGLQQALLLALQERHREAQASVPSIAVLKSAGMRAYHHLTYSVARIYALGGRSSDAVKWLRETDREGFPCYTLFLRDSFLDPIRDDPAFVQFMAELRPRWEGYRREF